MYDDPTQGSIPRSAPPDSWTAPVPVDPSAGYLGGAPTEAVSAAPGYPAAAFGYPAQPQYPAQSQFPAQPVPPQQYPPQQYPPQQYSPRQSPYPLVYPAGVAQQQPSPATERRFGLVTLVVVTAIAAVLSCGVGLAVGAAINHKSDAPAGTAGLPPVTATDPVGSVPSSAPPAPGAIAAGDGAALLAKILPTPSGGKTLKPTGVNGGVMNLDQFVAHVFGSSPDEKTILAARHFQVAAERDWLDTDGVEVHLQVIQFDTDVHGQGYVLGQRTATGKNSAVTGTFPVPGVTLGEGFEKSALDDTGNHRTTILAQDGPLAVVIFFYTPNSYDRPSEIDLMQRQIAALR